MSLPRAHTLRLAIAAGVALLIVGACAGRRRNPLPDQAPSGAFFHYLEYGERLEDVARRYGRAPDAIVVANNIRPGDLVYEGQRLLIPPLGSAIGARKTPGPLPSRRAQAVVRTPPPSMKRTPAASVAAGPARTPPPTRAPSVTGEAKRKTVTSAVATKTSSAGFSWPVAGVIERVFCSEDRDFCPGLDIAAPRGRPVRAAQSGTVLAVGELICGYGPMIILGHARHYTTIYANTEDIRVKQGGSVKQGEVIAYVGQNPEKPRVSHLHFQIRKSARAVDPVPLLPKI